MKKAFFEGIPSLKSRGRSHWMFWDGQKFSTFLGSVSSVEHLRWQLNAELFRAGQWEAEPETAWREYDENKFPAVKPEIMEALK